MALGQIRAYLIRGDPANAKQNLAEIFEGNRIFNLLPLPRDNHNLKEISKEELYPGNYYLAKLNKKTIRETGIKTLLKLSSLGINEFPVLLILHDNSISQCLVLYNDIEFGSLHSFWISFENILFLEYNVKVPSANFKLKHLKQEFSYFEHQLRIFYSKNSLTNLLSCLATKNKINEVNELVSYIELLSWQNFKISPIAGIFQKLSNFIRIKKTNIKELEAENTNQGTSQGTIQSVSQSPQKKSKKNLIQKSNSVTETEILEKILFSLKSNNK